jgi:uncharacterized membrane protein
MSEEDPIPDVSRKNIHQTIQIEQQLFGSQSRSDRLGAYIVSFFGSLQFVAVQVAFVAVWVVLNIYFKPFDPYPFPLLSLVVGLEFILFDHFRTHQSEK